MMILRFDTEQGGYHIWQSIRRIHMKLGLDTQAENYKVFGLRPYSPKERIQIIQNVIGQYESQGIQLIVIDGISDLVNSINELEECTKVVSLLLKWSQELNCHIVCVLHENPGSDKLRGHLGTEVTNKAESTLGVEKRDNRVSIVSGKFTRNGDFPPFDFEITPDGIPEIMGVSKSEEKNKRKSNKPTDYAETVRLRIAAASLADQELTATELNASIINEASQLDIELSDKPARLWIDQLLKDGFIVNIGTANRKQFKLNHSKEEISKLLVDGELPF
jgi:hypothetical protein